MNVYRKRSELYRKTGEKRLFVTYGAGESQGKGASKKTSNVDSTDNKVCIYEH